VHTEDDARAHKLSRRRFLQSGLAVGAAAALPGVLAACGSSGSSKAASSTSSKSSGSGKELVVGHLTATTGVFAAVGAQMIDGFEIYLAMNGGKLGGRPTRTLTVNTQAEANIALQGAQRLVTQDNVDFVDGILSSASAAAVRNFFTQAEVPLVISNANNTTLSTTEVSPYIYRTSCTFAQYGTAAGTWFAKNVAKDNVWILAWDFVGGHEIAAAFAQELKAQGGTIGGQLFTPFPNTADFEPYLTKIKNAGAKGVYVFYGGSNAISFVQQYRQFGLFSSIPVLGLASLADSSVVKAEGANGLGWKLETFYYPLLQNATNQKFVAAYRKAYGQDPDLRK
jgi:branched-chain amino acid transport system substrate-binding protein